MPFAHSSVNTAKSPRRRERQCPDQSLLLPTARISCGSAPKAAMFCCSKCRLRAVAQRVRPPSGPRRWCVADARNACFRKYRKKERAHLRQATKVLCSSDHCRTHRFCCRVISWRCAYLRDRRTNPCPPTLTILKASLSSLPSAADVFQTPVSHHA